jgi:hypothetical protein
MRRVCSCVKLSSKGRHLTGTYSRIRIPDLRGDVHGEESLDKWCEIFRGAVVFVKVNVYPEVRVTSAVLQESGSIGVYISKGDRSPLELSRVHSTSKGHLTPVG